MVPRLLAVLAAALVAAPAASAAAPANLHAFLLRATEAQSSPHTFSRTPAFAWDSVRGATDYEFQLSTSSTFAENGIVWEKTSIKSPVTNVPLTLPWMTGSPYSWYARVRAVVNGATTPWSSKYGFNLRAGEAPQSLSSGANPRPGMVRWTPVQGATAYEVVFLYNLATGKSKKIKTATTAADLREYYSFHNDPRSFESPSTVYWRARAVRELEGTPLNNIPVVSYGPWSPLNTTNEPTMSNGQIDLGSSVSRSRTGTIENTTASGAPATKAHELVPGFWWRGKFSPQGYGACPQLAVPYNITCPLFHVYVYTDSDCVNRVHNSDVVGSPAYVPRLTGPLALPADKIKLGQVGGLYLGDGADEVAKVYDAGGEEVKAAGLQDGIPSDPDDADLPPGQKPNRKTGLWDIDWPDSRYYWTVVPTIPYVTPDDKVEFHDVAFGEDMCASGEMISFGKTSAPALANEAGVPYVSGLSSTGAVRSATTSTPSFFGRVVVAWKPAPGATRYQVQWSQKRYPWTTAGTLKTPATASLLNLPVGQWYYRVRGLDSTLPTLAKGMTWSPAQYLKIIPPTFTVG